MLGVGFGFGRSNPASPIKPHGLPRPILKTPYQLAQAPFLGRTLILCKSHLTSASKSTGRVVRIRRVNKKPRSYRVSFCSPIYPFAHLFAKQQVMMTAE